MTQDWLLVETLGDQPVVVAQGRQMKNFVPLAGFLRRNPNLAAIATAITETVACGQGLVSITPKTHRVIRTEPVTMTGGHIHGVHVWCGPPDDEPPERPLPGPMLWDFTLGESSGTVQYLINAGMDPTTEPTTGRSFVDDIPSRSINRDEANVLAQTLDAAPGRTYCATWEFADKQGGFRRVGFVVRTAMQSMEDGSEHLIARAMNLVDQVWAAPPGPDHLAQRVLNGLAEPGVYRLLMDLNTWMPLKWLDDPCPFFDWRSGATMHPGDRLEYSERMTEELQSGSTSAVLRLPGNDGADWVPLHITINRMELDTGVFAGLVTVRQPTEDELGQHRRNRTGSS